MVSSVENTIKDRVLMLSQKYSIPYDDAIKLYYMGGASHSEELCAIKSLGAPEELLHAINAEMWDSHTRHLILMCKAHEMEVNTLPKTFNDLFMSMCKALGIIKISDWLSRKLNKKK